MEVKPGYKQTEIGVIPEEWEVKTLGSLTTLLTNGFVGTATTAYVEGDDGVLYIQGYNVQENGFNFHGIKRVSKAFHARNKKSCLQPGDLLTIQTGDIGVTTVVPPELAGSNCHALIISRLRKQESAPGYYCQYFNSERGRVAFKEIETGTTMKHLNGGDMKRLFLPSPPVEEQRAIAEALSDVDGLLGGLDRLIAKKRDLKQAAMQQLLTGQTRLPGSHGEWEVKTLHEVCQKIQDGTHFSPKLGGNDYLYVTSKNIRFGMLDMSTAERISAAEHFKIYARCDVKKGDLLLTKDGANTGNAALNPMDEPFSLLSSVAMLRFDSRHHSPAYFMYQILSNFGQMQIKDAMSGNAITRLTLQKIRALRFSVASIAEQTAIAEVLTEMDGELAGLEQRQEKTRALKQAMMQELLTGRTRLL